VTATEITAAEIKSLRLARRETQEQFARHFKVGRTTILNWERHGLPARPLMIRAHAETVLRKLRRKK
jgi:DNA-binding transcriptional regulator YiaG